ncbi:hypothetical protein LX16_0194 [Stackebrandtia albiflava]|uniref:Uncharacterized protein n=1 Tax=Stackebrandtia albiflava TaxID=406432 RepID=A0A562V9E2_9ACTN|nr:actinodefensin-associated protein B [Stackebrandtia albiflava]TWJ14509.1 hypothetical protein LX16_0194 [Stackebrandtia albiflava]
MTTSTTTPTPTPTPTPTTLADWRPAASTRLVTLPLGGTVLVDVETLACHELLPEADRLLRTPPGTPVGLTDAHHEFLKQAADDGWITRGRDGEAP